MSRTRKIVNVSVLLLATVAGGCATAPQGFARHPAAVRVEFPIFRGTPSVLYTHKKLGTVSGEVGFASSPGEGAYRALYNLSQAAASKGANAVIGAEGGATNTGYRFTGEAVEFDILPPLESADEDKLDAEIPKDPERGD